MRDFRDAKAMAHALRDALRVKAVETTHSECLELIAKTFGYANWNVLSAKIDAAEPRSGAEGARSRILDPKQQKTLYCTFCGKSQHEVRKLIAGPAVYICDGCVDLCTDIVDEDPDHDEKLFRSMQGDEERARAMSTEDLAHYVERSRKGAGRSRLILNYIERTLALREGEVSPEGDILAPRFAYLKNKPLDELAALRQSVQQKLKRYEDTLRIATTMLGERRQ
jgi:hypothetical protein